MRSQDHRFLADELFSGTVQPSRFVPGLEEIFLRTSRGMVSPGRSVEVAGKPVDTPDDAQWLRVPECLLDSQSAHALACVLIYGAFDVSNGTPKQHLNPHSSSLLHPPLVPDSRTIKLALYMWYLPQDISFPEEIYTLSTCSVICLAWTFGKVSLWFGS